MTTVWPMREQLQGVCVSDIISICSISFSVHIIGCLVPQVMLGSRRSTAGGTGGCVNIEGFSNVVKRIRVSLTLTLQ